MEETDEGGALENSDQEFWTQFTYSRNPWRHPLYPDIFTSERRYRLILFSHLLSLLLTSFGRALDSIYTLILLSQAHPALR